jgi:hypothetical protein
MLSSLVRHQGSFLNGMVRTGLMQHWKLTLLTIPSLVL